MTDYRAEARRAAQRHGIDPDTFERQIGAESGFDPHARSPAGARGIAQFMPGTARGLGVNPDDPIQALNGAAKLVASYIKKYGSYRNALIAYNAGPGAVGGHLPAETRAYIAKILRGGGGGSTGGTRRIPGRTVTTPAVTDQRGALREALLSGRKNVLLQADYLLGTGAYTTPASSRRIPGRTVPASGGSRGTGSVKVARGANRKGVNLNPALTGFARQVAGVFGGPLTLTTGSNHSQYTTTGNVSDHWDGHGGDFAASGETLTKMGRAALRAAGMSARRANKIKGGAFTMHYGGHRIQIIFNSNVGGNHYNHLHLGVR